MDNLNKSGQKNQRACTTPQRMRLVQSIKKSIHRSIDKINPGDYKNILKGQFIYMHLCYKGQIINSQYTKVALFMGAIVLKKAVQKITAVVTNDTSNKIVKKLKGMNKPILSVLWLQACFQQKRKVAYQDFLYQDDTKNQMLEGQKQRQKQQQINANFDCLINNYKIDNSKFKQFANKHNFKFLRFMDKRQRQKQKQKGDKIKGVIIPIHQIDIGAYLPQRRKSQPITDRGNNYNYKKKNQKKKVQFKDKQIKSQVYSIQQRLQKQSKFKSTITLKKHPSQKQKEKEKQKIKIAIKSQQKNQQQNNNYDFNIKSKQEDNRKQNQRLNKHVYQKYLKDFKNFQAKIKQETTPLEQPQFKMMTINQYETDITPCFMEFNNNNHNNKSQQNHNDKQIQTDVHIYQTCIQTPTKTTNKLTNQQLIQTYSIKKQRNKNIKLNIINPMNSQKIQKINHIRQIQNMPLLQIAGNDSKNITCVINKQSKIQAILAMLSKPRLIVTQSFISSLEKQPTSDITQQFYKKYEIKYKLNINEIQGKKIVLLDSVMGVASLSNIIKQCNGTVISMPEFFFQKDVDFVITNKKMFLKVQKKQYKVLSQADFIDMLICIQK